jgi:hypothetical protein
MQPKVEDEGAMSTFLIIETDHEHGGFMVSYQRAGIALTLMLGGGGERLKESFLLSVALEITYLILSLLSRSRFLKKRENTRRERKKRESNSKMSFLKKLEVKPTDDEYEAIETSRWGNKDVYPIAHDKRTYGVYAFVSYWGMSCICSSLY